MAKAAVPRLYHQTSLLLRDGRILVAGSGGLSPMPDQKTFEIYSPPYLFKGTRPTLSNVPALVQHGSQFNVTSRMPLQLQKLV
jgi:hypothetical protein